MVPFTLDRVFGTADTFYTSEAVTIVSSEAFVGVTVQNGTLVLDGHDMGVDPIQVPNGSVVSVRLKSSSEPGHTTYATLQIEDQISYFAVTTYIAGAIVYDAANAALPLDFQASAYHQGQAAWQPNNLPRLHKLNGVTWVESTGLTQEETNETDQREYAFVADRWSNRVFRVNLATNTVAQAIYLPAPVAVGRVAINHSELGEVFHYIVAQENGNIVRLDPLDNYAASYVCRVEGKAVALESDVVNNSVWVIDTANRLTRLTFDLTDGTFERQYVGLGNNAAPSDLVITDTHVFVSLFGKKAVARVDKSDLSVSYIACCPRPAAITADATIVYVAGHDAQLSTFDIVDLEVKTVESDALTPTFIQVVGASLLVSDHQSNSMMRIDNSGRLLSSFSATKPLGVAQKDSATYLFTSVPNAPSRFGPGDNTPTALEFVPRLGRDRGEQVLSAPYTIAGVNLPVNVSVDPLSNSVVLVGDEERGTNTVAEPGERIVVATTLPNAYEKVVETQVTVGDTTAVFVTSTLDRSSIPDSIVFEHVQEALPDTTYTSNAVTIIGMSEGAVAEVFVENATLLINGEETSDNTIQNGDTVALVVRSGETSATTGVLRVGPIEAQFFVHVQAGEYETVMPFVFEAIMDAEPGAIVRSNTVVVDWLVSVDPLTLYLSPVYSASIVLNGELVGSEVDVFNGDEIAVEMELSSGHNIIHELILRSGKDSTIWQVLTLPDLSPKMFALSSVKDGFLRQEYPSESITIEGLSTGFSTAITVRPEMPILLNGERLNEKEYYTGQPVTFEVTNGDVVQFIGIPGPVYGMLRQYVIEAGEMRTYFNVYARPVNGAYEDPSNYFFVEHATEGFSVGKAPTREGYSSIEAEAVHTARVLDVKPSANLYASGIVLADKLEGESSISNTTVAQRLTGVPTERNTTLAKASVGEVRVKHSEAGAPKQAEAVQQTHSLAKRLEGYISSTVQELVDSFSPTDKHSVAKLAAGVVPDISHILRGGIEQAQAEQSPRSKEYANGLAVATKERTVGFLSAVSAYLSEGETALVSGYKATQQAPTSALFDGLDAYRATHDAKTMDNERKFYTFAHALGYISSGSEALPSKAIGQVDPSEFVRVLNSKNVAEQALFERLRSFQRYADSPEFVRYLSPAQYADSHTFTNEKRTVGQVDSWAMIRRASNLDKYFDFWNAVRYASSHQTTDFLGLIKYANQIRTVSMVFGHDERSQDFHVVAMDFKYQGLGGRIFQRNNGFSADMLEVKRKYFARPEFQRGDGVFVARRGFDSSPIVRSQGSNAWLQKAEFVFLDTTKELYKALESGVLLRNATYSEEILNPTVQDNGNKLPEGDRVPETTGTENMFMAASRSAVGHTVTVVSPAVPERKFEVRKQETFEDKKRETLTSTMMLYHSSAEDAYNGALDAGVEPERIQVYELYIGCWVWAEVLDQPDPCEIVPDITGESGWLKGG